MTAARPLPRVSLRRQVRTLAALVALAGACCVAGAVHAASTDAASWNLERLMSTLGQKKSGRASFIETKYLSIAAEPVTSSGELVFTAPDHLEKRTDSPKPEDLVVDGDKLTIARNGHKYTLALTQYPELSAF